MSIIPILNENEHTIRLTIDSARRIFEALENPPPTNNKLLEAAGRRKEQGGFFYSSKTPKHDET